MKKKPKQRSWNPVTISFYKVGGTWDMIKKNGQLTGSGGLDDEALYNIEESIGFFKPGKKDIALLSKKLVKVVEEEIQKSSQHSFDLVEHLPWVPRLAHYAGGSFTSLYSGDSSHLSAELIAPLVTFLLKKANEHPENQVLGAQGTDTADIAILSLLEVFSFDTQLLPFLFTGANRSHREWNSDAPANFSDLFQLAGAHLPSGAYWVFANHLYRSSDLVKIDPSETRRIENYSTFFAPRLTARFTRKAIDENHVFHKEKGEAASKNHISQKITTEKLFEAMQGISIVDLGNQNNTHEDIEKILDKKKKGIVVAAHSLGNASNPIRFACIEAVKQGKLVAIVSRSLIPDVNERYAVSLLSINGKELSGSGKQIIAGHKMNKNIAKSLLVRAVSEGLNQKTTQELFNVYCESRGLL